ncbi:hypothetical protein BGZ49_005369 [Haplosporangium sp. Z 27]|nr:hypothetical protein BGZ49_005369 [Haplosporangium sp. Z 27]
MDKEHYSILLLKDAPSSKSDSNDSSSHDPYKAALHASTRDNLEITVEYLAPLTTLYPDNTLLSRAITEGYPKTPYHHNHENSPSSSLVDSNNDDQDNKDCIWAFAVTSQNAVHAFEKALQIQSDPDIRDAWLQIPIYCLTGATLASVKKIGFKNINHTNTSITSESSSTPLLSFNNASQLVDFLVSIEWPKSNADKDDIATTPILWFLTGEVRMKTMAEKLTEYQKSFREVVVYETGERPEFTQEFYHWLKNTSRIKNNNNNNNSNEKVGDNIGSSENNSIETNGNKRTVWLVGFSPRGVDISMPTLNQFLKDENEDQVQSNSRESSLVTSTEIRWAAIGATTGKRIQEHLSEVILKTTSSNNKDDDDDAAHQQHLQDLQKQQWNVTLNSKVIVAKAPKPGDLAEAILL